jgi:putative chitinase
MDRAKFFAEIKTSLFRGKFTPGQIAGIDAVLNEAEKRKTPIKWLAYMLATDIHETARTMQPIAEYGRGKGKKYGKPMRYKQAPYGRGLVQLTWDFNYETADQELGLCGALLENFDLAMKMEYAVKIMFSGMEQGWFTKKKLADFTTYLPMRKIINGMDKAADIAGYAVKFENGLHHAGYGKPVESLDAHSTPKIPPAVQAVVDDAAAEGRWSVQQVSNTALGVSATGMAVKEAVDATKDTAMSIASLGPWVLVAAMAIGIAVYAIYKRQRQKNAARAANGEAA